MQFIGKLDQVHLDSHDQSRLWAWIRSKSRLKNLKFFKGLELICAQMGQVDNPRLIDAHWWRPWEQVEELGGSTGKH